MVNRADTGFDDPARTTASVRRRDQSAHIAGPTMSDARPRPTFLYIGTPKSGSTWIYEALRSHPQVFVPVAKDLQFFDNNYRLGWDWYLRHFKNAGSAVAVGDLSQDYYWSAPAAARIRAELPEIRLICCLREPGDFAISALRWIHNHTGRLGSNFGEIAEHLSFARLLSYRENLEIYFDLFPRDQILVVFYEDLKAEPRTFIRQLYQFIGVDPDYEPAVLSSRSNVTRPPRSRMLLRLAFETAQLLRRLGAANLVGAVRWNPIFDKLVYRGTMRREDRFAQIELDRIAERVRQEAAGELDALARLIGKPLPAQWLRAAHRRS